MIIAVPRPLPPAVNKLVYESEGKKVEVALSSRPVSLGRSDEADHKLPTKTASRIHAQVFPRDRAWWVEDLGSSNGTLVNGNKIMKAMPLVPGDVITVGDVLLKYEGEAAPSASAPDHLVARIVWQPGKNKAPIETLIRDRITIGRKPDNSLQIDHKAVSGHHVEIVNKQGAYQMRDLGSSNGTYIQKNKVSEHTLRNGDVIILGKKINVYFVDPAGSAAPTAQPQPAGSAPPPAPNLPQKPAAKAASSAAGASDRGSFAPVAAAPAKQGTNPLPHMAVGVGLGLLFLLVGWLLGQIIGGIGSGGKADNSTREPEAPLADAAMSFEGPIDERGNPQGWTASIEALGSAKVELLTDTKDPFDGLQSLAVGVTGAEGNTTLVLQTTQARKLDLGGAFQLTVALRGEGATKLAISVSALDEKGNVVTLAAGSFVGIKSTAWGQFNMTGMVLNSPPADAQLRVLITGAFSKLWIDRVDLQKTADALATKPFQGIDAPNLSLAFDKSAPAQAIVTNTEGRSIRFQPLLLSAMDRNQSEDDLWAVSAIKPDSVSWTALLPSQGDAAAVRMRANGYDNTYFNDHGLRLEWDVTQGASGTMAVRIMIPMPKGATVALADRRGFPMGLDADAVHAYSYSTVSELMVNETNLSVSFPRGAVVWFDLSRAGELLVTARAASNRERTKLGIDVNTRPLMFARLYERLLNEAGRMLEAGHYSAGEARLQYLCNPSRPDKDLPVITRAHAKLDEVATHRTDLVKAADDAWQAVQTARDKPRVKAAISATRRYIDEFPGDAALVDMQDRLMTLETWEIELNKQARTPAEMKIAESVAKGLYGDADTSFKRGDYLMALVLLDTIERDYADTSLMNDAQALRIEIEKKLTDKAAVNKAIDAELARIDEDIKFADYADAREKCLNLFKKYPDSDRTREIMQRLRKIEDAFDD